MAKAIVIDSKQKLKPDTLLLVRIGKESVKFDEIRFNSEKEYEFKDGEQKYKIQKHKLLKRNNPLFRRLRKIRQAYAIIFNEGEEEPLTFDLKQPEISAKELYLSVQSKQTMLGLKGLLAKPSFALNWKIFLFAGVIVAVAIYLFITFNQGGIRF